MGVVQYLLYMPSCCPPRPDGVVGRGAPARVALCSAIGSPHVSEPADCLCQGGCPRMRMAAAAAWHPGRSTCRTGSACRRGKACPTASSRCPWRAGREGGWRGGADAGVPPTGAFVGREIFTEGPSCRGGRERRWYFMSNGGQCGRRSSASASSDVSVELFFPPPPSRFSPRRCLHRWSRRTAGFPNLCCTPRPPPSRSP